MLSGIASVIGAIGNSLKKADRVIKQRIKKNKKKLQKIDAEADKTKKDIVDAKIKAGYLARLNLAGTRLVLKIIEWLLYLLDLLIKLITFICSSVVLLVIVIAVVIIIFVCILIQDIGTMNELDGNFDGINAGGGTANFASLNWDDVLAKAEAKHKTGEFTDLDLNRVKFFYLCYSYAQAHPDTEILPETLVGMSMNEAGFSFYQEENGKNIFVDHSDFYQGGHTTYPNCGAIGPLQLDSGGKGYGDGSKVEKIKGIVHTKESPLGSHFNVDTFIPYSIARTFVETDIGMYTDKSNASDQNTEAYYMYKAISEWGIEETPENIKIIANMWLYTKHWVPYKFSSDGRYYIGGTGVGGTERWCEIVANIACAMFVETNGDIFAWGTNVNVAENVSSTYLRSTMHGTIRDTGTFGLQSIKPTLNDKELDNCVMGYLAEKYKDKSVFKTLESDVANFSNTAGSGGCVPTMATTCFCPIAGRELVVYYLETLGFDPAALSGGTMTVGGGSGAFGIEYYNSDGTVNVEAMNTLNAILYEFCKPENAYKDSITIPSEVTIVDKDGKDKKVKTNGGTYPNFWGMKYNITAATGNWGQCTWFAKGRAQLWMYENVGTNESQWVLGTTEALKMEGDGQNVANSMSGWCTVDGTLAGNSVASRSQVHVVFIEAVDKKTNEVYISHGNIKGKYSIKERRHAGNDWGSLPQLSSIPSCGSGWGFSYVQQLEANGSDISGDPYFAIAHLDKRK